MNELRILTGSKKGARLALVEGSLQIGPTFESDLMFASEEIGNATVTIKTSPENSSSISERSSRVLHLDGTSVQDNVPLRLSDPIKIGDIWFSVAEESAVWDITQPWLKQGSPSSEKSNQAKVSKPKQRRGAFHSTIRKSLVILLLVVLAGFFDYPGMLGNGSMPQSVAHASISPNRMAVDKGKAVEKNIKSVQVQDFDDLVSVQDQDLGDLEDKKMEKDKGIVTGMLFEREITNVTLSDDGNSIVLDGFVNQRDLEKVDRMISRMEQTHPSIRLLNNTDSLEQSLPFEIVSVSHGANSRIIVEDHGVVSVGESVNGYILESINDGTIRFIGKQTLEVNW